MTVEHERPDGHAEAEEAGDDRAAMRALGDDVVPASAAAPAPGDDAAPVPTAARAPRTGDDARARVRDAMRDAADEARAAAATLWPPDDERRFRNALLDRCSSDFRPYVELLLTVAARGVEAQVAHVRPPSRAAWDAQLSRLALDLAGQTFLRADMARWAVETWAWAHDAIPAAWIERPEREAAALAAPLSGATPAARTTSRTPPAPMPWRPRSGGATVGAGAVAPVVTPGGSRVTATATRRRKPRGGFGATAPPSPIIATRGPFAGWSRLDVWTFAVMGGALAGFTALQALAFAGTSTEDADTGAPPLVRTGAVVDSATLAGALAPLPPSEAGAEIVARDVASPGDAVGNAVGNGVADALVAAPDGVGNGVGDGVRAADRGDVADAARDSVRETARAVGERSVPAVAPAATFPANGSSVSLAGRWRLDARPVAIVGTRTCERLAGDLVRRPPMLDSIVHEPGSRRFHFASRPSLTGVVGDGGFLAIGPAAGVSDGVSWSYRLDGRLTPTGFVGTAEMVTRAMVRWRGEQQCRTQLAVTATRLADGGRRAVAERAGTGVVPR